MNHALNDIFSSLVISPQQQMKLRNMEAEYRSSVRAEAAQQAADESRADDVRHKLDQQNREYLDQHSNGIAEQDKQVQRVAYQCGMGCVVREFDGDAS